MTAGLTALLAQWLPQRRWYASKNVTPRLEVVQGAREGAFLEVFAVDHAPAVPTAYQVPLTLGHAAPGGVVGTLPDGTVVGDALADPEYVARRLGWDQTYPAQVLSGEQSNTSVVTQLPRGPVVTKFFRRLSDGVNPDVELTRALSQAGVTRVPRFVSAHTGDFPGGHGDLDVTQEFLAGSQDGWKYALSHDAPFPAADLGRALAEVHAALLTAFGSEPARPAQILDEFVERQAEALDLVPQLARYQPALDTVLHAPSAEPWPAMQRIHGDFHLGQILLTERGWVLIDFEGEPRRPLTQRRQRDFAARDVAGMLRSFDYARAAGGHTEEWAARARHEFTAAYRDAAPRDAAAHPALMRALELDKALYEAAYEATNRPTWLPIPLDGIARLMTPQKEN